MKKALLLLFSAVTLFAAAQTTATNFTVNDCAGNSHTLFNELDAGKVVVLVWVMPCGACIGPSLTTYNVVQSFSTSGCDVRYYLVDDYANSNCTTVSNWASSNGITPTATFTSTAINMNDYGSTGMPKVVVIGGASHTVFYNANNSVNSTSLQNAITNACAAASAPQLEIAPKPLDPKIISNGNNSSILFHLSKPGNLSFGIYDLSGERVFFMPAKSFGAGDHNYGLDLTFLPKGIYMLKMETEFETASTKFVHVK